MKKIGGVILLVFLISGFSTPKPKVLIIGDSISIGYFPFIKEEFSEVAILTHNPRNARYTGHGLNKIREWLGTEKWDIIQFNWGLWDLAYRRPTTENPMALDKENGKITSTTDEYGRNLDSLVHILKGTGAKLIFVTTTFVPKKEPGRYTDDVEKYNKIAEKIMKANGVIVNDIYARSKKIHNKYGLGDNNVHYTKEGYRHLA
ncbi:MAG: SGNH/GDSL hydrolase family protein, partial [Ferruginibacter sp.]